MSQVCHKEKEKLVHSPHTKLFLMGKHHTFSLSSGLQTLLITLLITLADSTACQQKSYSYSDFKQH